LSIFAALMAIFFGGGSACADSAPFDLAGPKVDVRVERSGKTLPISAVPNLQPGDRLWIHPDLPESETVHYLLIVAFLRGSTNPPPESWFTRAETWNKKIRDEGVFVVVPSEAEQALVFLAPETGGDFGTLRKAVLDRPGAFVRASQDLNVASLDRMRLETYLEAVRDTAAHNPEELEERSKLLARSLNIKVDPNCFDKPANEQATCLTSHTDQMVLADSHSQSMVSTVTTGNPADLMGQLAAAPMAGAGYFSPYVGAIIDIARILDNLHTADYQYIPALSLPKTDTLNLKLNNPPSFRHPKSVIVIALPPVEAPQIPPLRGINPKQVYCVEKPETVLSVEGAPLVFATEFAHDLTIHIPNKTGPDTVFPVTADPKVGGFAIDPKALGDANIPLEATGYLRGMWGFHAFDGPSFHLASSLPEVWHVAAADDSALITGRKDAVHLHSDSAACVSEVTLKDGKDEKIESSWKASGPDDLQVEASLEKAAPGKFTMNVTQYGQSKPDDIALQAYSEAGHLKDFTLFAGDTRGILRGTRLDEVAGIELNNVSFTPGTLSRVDEQDELQMSSPATGVQQAFKPEEKLVAKVLLKDGRTIQLPTIIATPRPEVALISKSIQPEVTAMPIATPVPPVAAAQAVPNSSSLLIHLGQADELPLNERLSFSVKSVVPEHFPRTESIDVATDDESLHTTLSVANGRLVLEDATTVVATLDPQKDLGPSAFGALKFRPVDANGAAGNWQPLAELVRLPVLTQLKCVKTPEKQCTLSGTNLFLIDAIASDPDFSNSVSVPEGFADLTIVVPHPDASKTLYVKLRDDPSAVNTAQPVAVADPAQSSVAGPGGVGSAAVANH
jgi:hypothetical protein